MILDAALYLRLSFIFIALLAPPGILASSRVDFPPMNHELVKFAKSLQLTTDFSKNLQEVLEKRQLKNRCKKHFKRVGNASHLSETFYTDEQAVSDMVLCGKWIFLYGDFESRFAMPYRYIQMLTKVFPEKIGTQFSKLGLYKDPESKLPVGLTAISKAPWNLASPFLGKPIGMSCAGCHFGKMQDGRYAIGMPNENLRLGLFNAYTLLVTWLMDSNPSDEAIWPKAIQVFFEEAKTQMKRSSNSLAHLLTSSGEFIGGAQLSDWMLNSVKLFRPIPGELSSYLKGGPNQYYASSPSTPLSSQGSEGKTEIFLSAPQIWNLYTEKPEGFVMASIYPTNSLEKFIQAAYIMTTGYGKFSIPKYVEPLALYLRTLEAPKSPFKRRKKLANQGHALFQENCSSCHDLAISGRSTEPTSIEKIKAPTVLLNPLENYAPPHWSAREVYNTIDAMAGIPIVEGVYSRPLAGIWTRTNLMKNGSVKDIDEAFCLTKPRRNTLDPQDPLYGGIHSDLCSNYTRDQKVALIEYLKGL